MTAQRHTCTTPDDHDYVCDIFGCDAPAPDSSRVYGGWVLGRPSNSPASRARKARRPLATPEAKAAAYAERTRRRTEKQADANAADAATTRAAMCDRCFTVPAASGECLC